MSTAKLNVWVTALGQPCRIDMAHQWYVHVLHCNGEILTWCNRKFTNILTQCGHAEIDVPPGCYVVCATWSPGSDAQHLGNHLTHCSIVQVRCGDHACVNLFSPTLHNCGTWFVEGVRDAIRAGRVDQAVALRAEQAVQDLLAQVPADPFTANTAKLGMDAAATGTVATADTTGDDFDDPQPRKK